ncbi:MAG: response regulator, partial [Cyanobacteria bacterium SID2]|nr:response regulator [Cyanobacteria bacterium SID2]
IARDWANVAVSQHERIVGYEGETRKILLVDDKWENRTVVADLLKPLGFDVLEAANGEEGLERTTSECPDLIITDLVMPVLDGFEMIRRLRQNPEFETIPIIASSASVFEADRSHAQEVGGDDFLPKPVQMGELLDRLRLHLQLDWVYSETPPPKVSPVETVEEATEQELIVPPSDMLEELLHLAMRGHLKGIRQQAKKLEALDEKYAPFARKLDRLAKGFHEREILELLKNARSNQAV